jgi:uncharacterized membrane protein YvbJ
MIDEDPSPQDLDRFGHDTAYCPACGGEIWDQAEFCPSCGDQVGGRTSSRPPLESWLRRRWLILVAIGALVALLAWVL